MSAFGGRLGRVARLTAPVLLALASCVGDIGSGAGGGGPSGPSTPGGGSTGGGSGPGGGSVLPPPPPTGGQIPDDAPTTGTVASQPVPTTRFSRLSHKQWEATVRDLLRLAPAQVAPRELSASFVSEPRHLSKFDTDGAVREVTGQIWSGYQAAAERLAKLVARDPKLLAGILPQGLPSELAARAKAFVSGFGLRAHRRPLTDAEVTLYTGLFNQGARVFASGDAFADGVELTLQAFLQSPSFLYRTELASGSGGRVALTDFEVASRLSYGLLGSMPDDRLLADAQAGQLRTVAAVRAHAIRLLETPAAADVVRDFHGQVLKTSEYDGVKRDEKLFPAFVGVTGADLARENLTLVEEVFSRGLGVTELLTAPYSFVNSKLAGIYGVKLPAPAAGAADPFVRVDLNPAERAGVLTQIGFLAAHATDQQPRSIVRGVLVNDEFLCVGLPAPPNMPPELKPSTGKTNRQVVAELTETGECAACHSRLINPLGFAFEEFDSIGRHRTQDNGFPVDASGSYTFTEGQKSFKGAAELIKHIADSRQAHECYTRHLLEYIHGRELAKDGDAAEWDKALVKELGHRSRRAVSVRALIADLIATDAFLYRLP